MTIEVVIVGAPAGLAEALKEELAKMGRDDINVSFANSPGVSEAINEIVNGDESCECPLCAAGAEARAAGRSPYVHPDIQLDADSYVKDKVRHRLFKGPQGDVCFFDNLFHPMHELNLFTTECERGAQGLYQVTPVLDADGNQLWQVMDWSDGTRQTNLDHVGGELENVVTGQRASISMISGPWYEHIKAEAMAKAKAE